MAKDADPLSSFHPLVREWFLSRYRSPTAVQAEAWTRIAAGEHVLALAPTGSGKTLAAFLEALSRIALGEMSAKCCSVLYVSPLKALGEDIKRNLEDPLGELARLFASKGADFPAIRVATRTGDTTQAERRRMLSSPPSILVTTPESLGLMLDSPLARRILDSVRLLVLDEIHAVAGTKRGSLLACSVGRLALLAGEFQRVALSATVRPASVAAAFVGGRRMRYGEDGKALYEPRRVSIVAPPSEKRIELRVEWPPAAPLGSPAADSERAETPDRSRYAAIVPALLETTKGARSTIVFAEARRRAERLAFLLNEAGGEGTAWAHHGSLSKEARRVVEERLKAGQLRCVVATASLELGIDVGQVDEVALAGAPGSVSSAMQRLGRAGHGVGETSRGVLYPFHGMDLALAAAVRLGVEERAVEELRPPRCPLDILAQALLAISLEGPRRADALYDIIRSFPPFEELSRGLFDSVLEMLAGRYSDSRLRELEPRIFVDRETGVVTAKEGSRTLLYSSGGAIPDRGLYSLRVKGSRTKIGELDEEFVWERSPGDAFSFGTQAWRIVEIGPEAVEVAPLGHDADFMPFWKGEARFRSPEITDRLLGLMDGLRGKDALEAEAELRSRYSFSSEAARACASYLASQEAAGGGRGLPGRLRLVVEVNRSEIWGRGGGRGAETWRILVHTLRGLAVNQPFAIGLAAAWEERSGLPAQAIADDDRILLLAPAAELADPAGEAASLVRGLADSRRLREFVRSRLEGTGLFGAQFRENAGRALLLPRGLPGKRTPLWITRLRAKRLFDALKGREDFPIIAETWRSCLADLLDLDGCEELLAGVSEGRIEVASFESRLPSPFAREALWQETNEFLYRGDELSARASSSLSDRVISEALRSSRLRPGLSPRLVEEFGRRLKRLLPGWGPDTPLELAEWVRERVLVPEEELGDIVSAGSPGLAAALAADPGCGGKLRRLRLSGAAETVLVHADREAALLADPAALVAEWMRREGPVSPGRLCGLFGLGPDRVEDLLGDLAEEGTVVADLQLEGVEGSMAIDAQNLEILLRRARAAARPRVETRSGYDLLRLVAAVQGIRARTPDLERILAPLAGFPLPVALWEAEALPLRLGGYSPALLDAFLSSEPWQWFGAGRSSLSLARAEDLELFLEPRPRGSPGSRILGRESENLGFWDIMAKSASAREGSTRSTIRELAMRLWGEAWKGLVASDSFVSVREGLANGFGSDLPEAAQESGEEGAGQAFGLRRRIPRALRERWKKGAPVSGLWFRLDLEEEASPERDPLDEEELRAARVRILLRRYGLVCRSILERELPPLKWGPLFPTLRRLELSGEVFAGRFFDGLEGPQFLGEEALRLFLGLAGTDTSGGAGERAAIAWVNCLDPLASALYALEERPSLPARLAGNRVCVLFSPAGPTCGLDQSRAGESALPLLGSSSRSWRDLVIGVGAEQPLARGLVESMREALRLGARNAGRVLIETVNGESASRSAYAPLLSDVGFERDRGRMVLW